MILKIKYAEKGQKNEVLAFFHKNIFEENDGIVNEEYLCPYWASSAINKNQIIIISYLNKVIWWLRFYPRKRENIVSVYQFAIDEKFRWKCLIEKMLEFSWYKTFESICFIESNFNEYYKKKWWENIKTDDRYNLWRYQIGQN